MNVVNINNKKWVLTSYELNNAFVLTSNYKLEKYIKNRFGESWFNLLEKIKDYKPMTFKNIKLTHSLGSGKNATVYLYKGYAIKKVKHKKYPDLDLITGKTEADIITYLNEKIVLQGYTPNIIWLFQYDNTSVNTDYLVLEKMEMTLWKYLQKTRSEKLVKGILFQVLFTLCILQYTLPGFRHNDIKTDNILLDFSNKQDLQFKYKDTCWKILAKIPLVKIVDFDYAFIPRKISNKKILGEHPKTFGCTKNPSKIYDAHLFLNSLYNLRHNYPESISKWIKNNFSHLGNESDHLKYGRLIYPEKWEKVYPSPYKLLQGSFFNDFKTQFDKLKPFWGL